MMVGTPTEAGDTVTATVTIGTVSVTIAPTSFDYGTIPFSNTRASYEVVVGTAVGHNIGATVGSLPTDLDIKGAVTTDWTTLHATTAGVNTYVHKFGVATDEHTVAASYAGLTTSFDDADKLADNATGGSTVWFGLQIMTPTSGVATVQSAAVTVLATWSQ